MKCENCQSTNIKSRTNYTHGTKSKSTVRFTCKECGSSRMEQPQRRRRRR